MPGQVPGQSLPGQTPLMPGQALPGQASLVPGQTAGAMPASVTPGTGSIA